MILFAKFLNHNTRTTRTYQPPQRRENNNNSRYPQQQNYQNQGNSYQQSRYQQNIVPQYSIPQNQPPLYAQQVPYTQPLPQNYYQPPPITQTIPYYQTSPYSLSRPRAIDYNQGWKNLNNNQVQTNSGPSQPMLHASYLGFIKDQGFDKSTPQTKSNISPATITEDTTLAAIFLFDINNLNTHSLFSGAAINQDKSITALYTNARIREIDIKLILDSGSAGSIITKQLMDQLDCAATTQIITADGNTKTLIGEINNFSFKINGIQIPTKVLVMEATQYQALVGNNWLLKANNLE
ncbi:hypothetical protein G9A89_013164 [Geosiphon pyriformis]|nr:hypothetical protein G9A89_013164 [Geosiphon pyriformis]